MTIRVKDEATGLSVMDAQDFRRRFPDGRMFSNPGLATPADGERLLDAAIRDAIESLRKFISGEDIIEEAAVAAAAAAAARARKRSRSRWGDNRPSRTGGVRKGRWEQQKHAPSTPAASEALAAKTAAGAEPTKARVQQGEEPVGKSTEARIPGN